MWATIVVLEGALRYTVDALGSVTDLVPGTMGIVIPEVRHHVTPLGAVRFYVEFHRAPDAS